MNHKRVGDILFVLACIVLALLLLVCLGGCTVKGDLVLFKTEKHENTTEKVGDGNGVSRVDAGGPSALLQDASERGWFRLRDNP